MYYFYLGLTLEAEAHALSEEDKYLAMMHEEVNDITRLFRKYKKVVHEQTKLEESRLMAEARLKNSRLKEESRLATNNRLALNL